MKSILTGILFILGSTSFVVDNTKTVQKNEMISVNKSEIISRKEMSLGPDGIFVIKKEKKDTCSNIRCWQPILKDSISNPPQ